MESDKLESCAWYEDLLRIAVETGTDGIDMTAYWLPSLSDDYLHPLTSERPPARACASVGPSQLRKRPFGGSSFRQEFSG